MCPNALLGNHLWHDDVTRDGFGLLTRNALGGAADRGTDVLVVEPSFAVHQWLTDDKAAAGLVQPDFAVLRLSRPTSARCVTQHRGSCLGNVPQ